jgi:NAD+ kinase
MKFKNVLLLYKRSAYRIYFLEKASSLHKHKTPFIEDEKQRFEDAHIAHYDTLHYIAKILFSHGVRFTEIYRGRKINYSPYDLIITVGGDGTFLEAARNSTHQVILGVNSAPNHSVGNFCIGHKKNFETILKKILSQKFSVGLLHRIQIKSIETKTVINALNDVLVCHANPAYLCRYYLRIGNKKEEQRSSGIWVSTPSGSTGAVHSAGGKVLDRFAKLFQYKPRELYRGLNDHYQLRGAVLKPNQKIFVTSLMRNGMVFIDGAHQKLNFPYGSNITIGLSDKPVKTICPK